MGKKTRNHPAKLQRKESQQELDVCRMAQVVPDGVDRENRSILMVLATEAPVVTYDKASMRVVEQTLKLDGMEIPKQVPMVDTHERNSVSRVLGSIRDLKVENGQLIGRAFFAADDMSRAAFEKYADGHLTDFSVGAVIVKREYQGTSMLITRSKLVEGSAVVAGQDKNAKAVFAMRALAEPEELRKEVMNEKLMEMLVERGLDKDADDKQILEFVERELDKDEPGIDAKTALDIVRNFKRQLPEVATLQTAEPIKQASAEDLQEIQRKANERFLEIDEICRTHNVEEKDRLEYLKGDKDVNTIAREILKRNFTPGGVPVGPGQTIERGKAERDKFYDAVEYTMVERCLNGAAVTEELKREIGEAPEGASGVRYHSITDIAREFCERAGSNVTGLPRREVIKRAMEIPSFVQRSSDGPAFHTTGSFANIFLNAQHKMLRQAYDEAPSTYQRWVRTASDAMDFRDMHKIVFGELNMPEEVGENDPYPEATTSDSREKYKVSKYGQIVSITLEMLVNDDLDAMQRLARMHGAAMRRKINRDAYSILIDNAALADGVALFHASSHGANLDSTALGESALDVGYNVMATQAGVDTTTVLGITPSYLIVPAALSATALRLVNGGVVPETTSNTPLYGAGRSRPLEVIVDGQIDALGSATNWWLAASNGVIDTVEISFLQGERTPVVERENGFETDTIKSKIRQTYGLKAIDYRGLYQGNS